MPIGFILESIFIRWRPFSWAFNVNYMYVLPFLHFSGIKLYDSVFLSFLDFSNFTNMKNETFVRINEN